MKNRKDGLPASLSTSPHPQGGRKNIYNKEFVGDMSHRDEGGNKEECTFRGREPREQKVDKTTSKTGDTIAENRNENE
jgi:hypothetical protein